MFIFVEGRPMIADAFVAQFSREGVAAAGLGPGEFDSWLASAGREDFVSIEGVLVGEAGGRDALPRAVRRYGPIPMVAINDMSSLDLTLDLFRAGYDDVVRKPVHVRELLARFRVIRRRDGGSSGHAVVGPMKIYFDGRDPEINGDALNLPRREKRILEFLAAHRGKRVTKAQIFHSIYGLFDDDVEENVVESHVSKLRKKLRERIGFDPIDSRRYLGYCLTDADAASTGMRSAAAPEFDARRPISVTQMAACAQ